jgi:undecaprenyl-diphosphatase
MFVMWDIVLLSKALVLGIVEGLTEFLPVSSTGHLIVVADLIGFNHANAKVFEIAIQMAAILAVIMEYKQRVVSTVVGLVSSPWGSTAHRFAFNVLLAFLPLAVVGLAGATVIKEFLFNPQVVASAFIVGGFVILWAERLVAGRVPEQEVQTMDDISPMLAFKVGLVQLLALVSGTSRSGATIIGGLCLGMSRVVATQFSFFLAMPTIFAAGLYELYGARRTLQIQDGPMFLVGSIAAFIGAYVCVRWLLRYIASNNFVGFAWYRIGFGTFILLTAYTGWVSWS